MKKSKVIEMLKSQHDIVLHPCLEWGSEDIDLMLERDGIESNENDKKWKQDLIFQGLEHNKEFICEQIFQVISEYIKMKS